VELNNPIVNEKSLENNFTNEGGIGDKIRFLRNIMGLWPLQRCRKEWAEEGDSYSYAEMSKMAAGAPAFKCFIEPDDASFLNPENMTSAISDYCRKTGQAVPESKPEFIRTILESLALKYRTIIQKIDEICPNQVEVLHIVGGGSQNELLNQFAANATGLPVIAGPVEATALGNVMVQAIATGQLKDIAEGRKLIGESFNVKQYNPRDVEQWQDKYRYFEHLLSL
jgi:rhamnulokinase